MRSILKQTIQRIPVALLFIVLRPLSTEPRPQLEPESFVRTANPVQIEILTIPSDPKHPGRPGRSAIRIIDHGTDQAFVLDPGPLHFSPAIFHRSFRANHKIVTVVSSEEFLKQMNLQHRNVYAQALTPDPFLYRQLRDRLQSLMDASGKPEMDAGKESGKSARNDSRDRSTFRARNPFLWNSTTLVRDFADLALDGELRRKRENILTTKTYRSTMVARFREEPLRLIVLYFLWNKEADTTVDQWEDLFLPEHLMSSLESLRKEEIEVRGQSRISEPRLLGDDFSGEDIVHKNEAGGNLIFVLALLGGIALFYIFPAFYLTGIGRFFYVAGLLLWSLVGSIAGILLAVLWFQGGEHSLYSWNFNLLSFHPLLLALPFLRLHARKRDYRTRKRILILYLFPPAVAILLHGAGVIAQQVTPFAFFAFVTQGLYLIREVRKNRLVSADGEWNA